MANSIATNDVAPGLLSYGLTLWYSADGSQYTRVPDLQEFPDMGNGGDREQIEVTTLVDPIQKFIDGLASGAGADGGLEFTGLYSNKPGSGFNVIHSIANKELTWQARVSDGLTLTWKGMASEPMLSGIGTNAAHQFTFTVSAGIVTYGGTYVAPETTREDMNGERIENP